MVGLDSTEPDVDDGHVGREHYDGIVENLSGHRVRILALHHHLIPIPGTGRERQIPVDAGDVLGLCKEASVDLVLSGHKHFPWIWNLDGTFFVTTGTATTRRLKGRSHPAMGMLDITDREMVLHGIKTDTLEREELLRAPLRNR